MLPPMKKSCMMQPMLGAASDLRMIARRKDFEGWAARESLR
jgi:hypothetical protein